MIKTAVTNPEIATRVRVAIDRDVAWHAVKLEASETSRRRPQEEVIDQRPASVKRKSGGQDEAVEAPALPAAFEENMSSTPSSSSQSPSAPKVRTKFAGKKQEERRVVGAARGSEPLGSETTTATPAMDTGGGRETVLVLPSGGTVRLRPRNDGDGNAVESSRIRTSRSSEKREASGDPLTEYPHTYDKYQKIGDEDDGPDMGLMETLE